MSKTANTRMTVSTIGICDVLTIVFVVLKLTGNIDWSWIWVLSPLWIPLALVLVFIGLAGLAVGIYVAIVGDVD